MSELRNNIDGEYDSECVVAYLFQMCYSIHTTQFTAALEAAKNGSDKDVLCSNLPSTYLEASDIPSSNFCGVRICGSGPFTRGVQPLVSHRPRPGYRPSRTSCRVR